MNMHSPNLQHLARRQRLWTPKPIVRLTPPPEKQINNVIPMRRYDDHVIRWQWWQANEATKCKVYIKLRCEGSGVGYDELTSGRRFRYIVSFRDDLIYELKMFIKPSISFPELGRLFLIDHSSAIQSYRRGARAHGDVNAAEALQKRRARQDERARERKEAK